jgi:hypothetical protein
VAAHRAGGADSGEVPVQEQQDFSPPLGTEPLLSRAKEEEPVLPKHLQRCLGDGPSSGRASSTGFTPGA